MTYFPKKSDIKRTWHLVDLEGKVLGKAAARIAHYLRGKHKAEFSPHLDCGDYVVVINAEKAKFTGKKLDTKLYYKHTGYMGHISNMQLKKLFTEKPKRVVEMAIAGMIPRNRLKKHVLSKLKIYVGPEHRNEAQKPAPLNIG